MPNFASSEKCCLTFYVFNAFVYFLIKLSNNGLLDIRLVNLFNNKKLLLTSHHLLLKQ